jgi:hypothetical protein
MSTVCQPTAPRYRLAGDVVLASLPGDAHLLLDFNGNCYAVSAETASLLRLALGPDRHALARHLSEQYGADAPQTKEDLDAFLHDLQHRGLLIAFEQPARRRSSGLAGLFLVPLLYLARWCLPGRARAWVLLLLARLSFWLFGWSRTVRAWQLCLRPAWQSAPSDDWEKAILRTTNLVRDVAGAHLFNVECKERALCSWALLRSAGWPATVVVGIQPFPISGHCWCESAGRVVGDSSTYAQPYVPVIRYQ